MQYKKLFNSIKNRNRSSSTGQVMVLSVVMLGGVLMSASAIAGLLMVYQIRQANDAVNSAKAIFAADTGIEWGIYMFSRPTSTELAPTLSNGASFTVTCYNFSFNEVNCHNASTSIIRSSGRSGTSQRTFQLDL